MFTQAFGEILTDILTVNPVLETIPSASAILDVSNYTFQATTFGKDAQGFGHHAHALSGDLAEISDGVYQANTGFLIVRSHETGVSSYNASSEHINLSSTYVSSLPNSPWITDTRLERGSTAHPGILSSTVASSFTSDLGHYPNAAVDLESVSSLWNVLGAFPPSGDSVSYLYFDSNNSFIFSGILSSHYNKYGLVDKNGYVTISPSAVSSASFATSVFEEGSILFSSTAIPAGTMFLKVRPASGDCISLGAFGGVNHVGVYCLDLKALLAQGLTPPYAWDALNNTRIYKLVAKVTSVEDLLVNSDVATLSGLQSLGNIPPFYAAGGPLFSCRFNFL